MNFNAYAFGRRTTGNGSLSIGGVLFGPGSRGPYDRLDLIMHYIPILRNSARSALHPSPTHCP